MKTVLALVAVILLAACASTGMEPAGSAPGGVKSEAGTVVDSQGGQVTTGKY